MKISARKKNIFLRVALVALAVYIVAALIQLQLQLGDGQKRISDLNSQLTSNAGVLAGLQEQMDNKDLYQEIGRVWLVSIHSFSVTNFRSVPNRDGSADLRILLLYHQ